MAKKVYVVWHGKEQGVFIEWQKCKDSIHGFPGAKYKAFKSIDSANKAFARDTNYTGDRILNLKVSFHKKV